MKDEVITIIGAGNGGFAMAADLALAGFRINLYELPQFQSNVEAISEVGGIEITGAARNGFAKLAKITTNIGEAVNDASYIIVVTQSLVHENIAALLAPVIRPDQFLYIMPGSGGSFLFAKKFREKGLKVSIAETITLPYGCRKKNPKSINVTRLLEGNMIGVLPSKNTGEVVNAFKTFYPDAIPMKNVLEAALYNPNLILHPAASVLNMARIEYAKGDFGLYQEGFSPSIMKVLFAIDREIMQIFEKLGMSVFSYKKLVEMRYKKSFEEQFFGLMCKLGSRGPFDVKTRYITEDVPIGLVLLASVGQWANVPTPTVDAIIQLAGLMNDTDYWPMGRTVEKLGIAQMTPDELHHFLREGEA